MSFDPPEANLAFRDKHDFAFELWTDTDRTLALHYGAAETPTDKRASRTTAVLDAQGRLQAHFEGVVNVLGHPAAVLEVCTELFGD